MSKQHPRQRYAHCLKKHAYPTEEAAKVRLDIMRSQPERYPNVAELEVYRCRYNRRYDPEFHIGNAGMVIIDCTWLMVARYTSHPAAWSAMIDAYALHDEILVVFQCFTCNGWHTAPGSGGRANRIRAKHAMEKALRRRDRQCQNQ
jgi:hypothetical protein